MPYNFYLGIDVSKASLSVVLMNSDSKVLWSSKKIANQTCTAKLILYTQGVEMGQDIIVLGT